MKILILANSQGGLYHFRKELIQKLLSRDIEIYILVPFGTYIEDLQIMGCRFIKTDIDRRGVNPVNDFRLLLFYRKVIKKINPTLVITYTIKPNIYGGIISRFHKIPYVINVTGLGTGLQKDGILKKFIIYLNKIACKDARVVFFENEENRQMFLNNRIIKENQAYKLNGAGVNLTEYQYIPYPEGCREIRLLFIGRLMKEKGIDELFEVAKRIKKEYNNVYFDIVGHFEENYRGIVNILQNEGIINCYGYQSNVKPFIEKASCLILPSYHEGMSNVLLESAASGRPLITSNIHGCLEAVEDGVNGYLVKVKDSEHLYSKIKEFIDLPYEKKVIMGKKSRELMKKEFDKKKVVEKTIRILTKVAHPSFT